jgi:hypothetical protein
MDRIPAGLGHFPMSSFGRSRGVLLVRTLLILLLVGLVAVMALMATDRLGGGGEGKAKDKGRSSFTLTYPSGWRPLPPGELAQLPGRPLMVLRRDDSSAFVVVRKQARPPESLNALAGELTRVLAGRIPDFQRRSAKPVRVKAGKAFLFSYIRKSLGTVHSIVLVPAGRQTYELNTVVRGGANQAAREVARIVLSFDA